MSLSSVVPHQLPEAMKTAVSALFTATVLPVMLLLNAELFVADPMATLIAVPEFETTLLVNVPEPFP